MRIIVLSFCIAIGMAGSAMFFDFGANHKVLQRLQAGPFKDVFVLPDVTARNATAYLIFQSGELDNPHADGLAHYVEHLAWLNAFGDSGAARHSNAWTSKIATGYWIELQADGGFARLDQLRDVSSPIAVPKKFAHEERRIVAREYDVRITENPYHAVFADVDRVLFEDTAWARSVLGQKDEIATFSLDDAKALHRQSHRPENATLVVYGAVDVADLEAYLNDLPSSDEVAVTAWPTPPKDHIANEQSLSVSGIAEPLFIYSKLVPLNGCAPAPKCSEAVDLLQTALESTLPGGLATPLRFDNFIARQFHVNLTRIGDAHILLHFEAVPDNDVSLDDLQAAFVEAFEGIARTGIPAETQDKLKARFLSDLDNLQRPVPVLRDHVIEQVTARRQVYDLDEARAAIVQIQPLFLNGILRQLTDPGRVVVRRVQPAK